MNFLVREKEQIYFQFFKSSWFFFCGREWKMERRYCTQQNIFISTGHAWRGWYEPGQILRKTAGGWSFPGQAVWPLHRSFRSSSRKPLKNKWMITLHTCNRCFAPRMKRHAVIQTKENTRATWGPLRFPQLLTYTMWFSGLPQSVWPFITWKECVHVKK